MDAFSIAASSAVSAIHRFDQAVNASVRDTAGAATSNPSPNGIGGSGDFVSDFVQQMQSQAAFQASISVVRATDQMTGQVLDIKA